MEVWKTEDPRVNFEKRFAHYEIYTWTLCHSYLHEKQTSRIQSLIILYLANGHLWRFITRDVRMANIICFIRFKIGLSILEEVSVYSHIAFDTYTWLWIYENI